MSLYHEIHGIGSPLVLIHGAFGNTAMLGDILPALAATRRVIAVDLQGHGRTPDVDRPIRPETMADDIADLLSDLNVDRADIISDETLAQMDQMGQVDGRLEIISGATHTTVFTPVIVPAVTAFLDAS